MVNFIARVWSIWCTREECLRRRTERDRARREMETPEEREARFVLNTSRELAKLEANI